MNTPDNNETMKTAIGCCVDTTDTLIVEAFFAHPSQSGAEAVARLLSECGYTVTAKELLDEA